jgi:hypothetical protein
VLFDPQPQFASIFHRKQQNALIFFGFRVFFILKDYDKPPTNRITYQPNNQKTEQPINRITTQPINPTIICLGSIKTSFHCQTKDCLNLSISSYNVMIIKIYLLFVQKSSKKLVLQIA